MALKKEAIQKIAALTKTKVEDIEAAIKDEKEVDLPISEKLTVLEESEVQTLKTNEYNSGKTAGVEMAVKGAKEKLGLDFTGKTIDGLVEAATKKALEDAKVTPDAKVKELETKVSTLQNTVRDYETKMAEKDVEVTGIRVNSELYKHIPAPGENGPALAQDDIIQLMKANGYEFKQESGAFKAFKGGQLVQDKLSNPLPLKDVVNQFMVDKKLVTEAGAPGGRGGDDKKPPVKAMKYSELKKQFEAQGKSTMGEEFNNAITQAVKENKEFDMNA
jgi:hypothetical protein